MHYCCKGIGKCCEGCCKCMDGCCSSCGKCLGACCKECSKICDRPFSSCLFLELIFMFCPFVICWVVAFTNLSSSCDRPIQVHLIIQGICLLLNFAIIIYLMYKYSTPQASLEGKSFTKKIVHLICYDFVICTYIFFLTFEFAWNIVGHYWLSDSNCDSSVLESIDLLGIIINWVYLGFIFLYLFFVGCLHCCEDCQCQGCCICFYYLCCCCCCFNKPKFGADKKDGNRASQKVSGWMQSFLKIGNLANRNHREQGRQMDNIPSAPPAPPGVYPPPQQGMHQPYPQAMYPPPPPPGYNPAYQQGYYPQHFK